MQMHLDFLIEQNRQDGMNEKEAREAALKEFGNIGSYKEECRDSWGIRTVQNIAQDLSFAWRQMKHAPGFVAVVILTLALGIGSVTTIFTIAYGLLIKPLPYPHPEELVMVFESEISKSPYGYVAPATYLHWRDQATDFESMALSRKLSINVFGPGVSFRAYALKSTANYFSMLGVQPALGRNFRPDEDTAGKSNVLVLSHAIWENQFAGNSEVIGQSVLLDKTPFIIVGVLPKSFQLDPRIDLYTPITLTAESPTDYDRQYVVMGRLKAGVSLAQATTQLETVSHQLAATNPSAYKGYGATLVPLSKIETEDGGPILCLLLGAVGCVLLITCANIANLMLARAGARRAEIAVRSALGAGRGRIFRQLLLESLLLAGIGGAAGICVGYWGLNVVRSFLPAYVHHLDQITFDGMVIAFTCLLTVFTGVTFGLVPALRTSRVDLNTALKDGARRGISGSARAHRLRSSLVVAQVALSLVLLSGAGLFVRSILKVRKSDVGYETKTTYFTSILFSGQKYPTRHSRLNAISRLVEALSQVHGIKGATFTNHTGPSSGAPRANYTVLGSTDGDPQQRAPLIYYGVTRDYFHTLKIPLIQ
jgi:putative ABC transport system permease protein